MHDELIPTPYGLAHRVRRATRRRPKPVPVIGGLPWYVVGAPSPAAAFAVPQGTL